MEQKKFEEALTTIDEGIAKAKEYGVIDYVKHAKALQKKGNAYCKMEKFEEAIDMYQKALIEN